MRGELKQKSIEELQRIRDAKARIAEAQRELDQAIRHALASDVPKQAIAEELGITRMTLHRWMAGRRKECER